MKISWLPGKRLVDGADLPVAVVLTEADKRNIANMAPDASVYCVFPDSFDVGEIQRWLEELKK